MSTEVDTSTSVECVVWCCVSFMYSSFACEARQHTVVLNALRSLTQGKYIPIPRLWPLCPWSNCGLNKKYDSPRLKEVCPESKKGGGWWRRGRPTEKRKHQKLEQIPELTSFKLDRCQLPNILYSTKLFLYI